MKNEWTVYRGIIIYGSALYELHVDLHAKTVLCLEDGDPEEMANASVWVRPPKAIINVEGPDADRVYGAARQATTAHLHNVKIFERMK